MKKSVVFISSADFNNSSHNSEGFNKLQEVKVLVSCQFFVPCHLQIYAAVVNVNSVGCSLRLCCLAKEGFNRSVLVFP